MWGVVGVVGNGTCIHCLPRCGGFCYGAYAVERPGTMKKRGIWTGFVLLVLVTAPAFGALGGEDVSTCSCV